jgi:hypothetical protein
LDIEKLAKDIRRQCNRARYFRYLIKFAGQYCWGAGIVIILTHQFLSEDGIFILYGMFSVPIVALLQWRKNRVTQEQALMWLEVNSGGEGFVLLRKIDHKGVWQFKAEEQLSNSSLRPHFTYKGLLARTALAGVFMIATSFVPLANPDETRVSSTLIKDEKVALQENIEKFSDVLVEEDPELQEILESIDKIDPADDVETGLESLDAISERLEQRKANLQESLQQLDDLLQQEYTDPTELQEAMDKLEQENGITASQMQQARQQKFSLNKEQKEKLAESIKQQKKQLDNKISNEQLQQMAENSNGNEKGKEKGEGKGKEGESEEGCDPATDPNCIPSGGGTESAPLTYGEKRDHEMRTAKSTQLSTDNVVDWENTVQLGSGPGQANMGQRDSYQVEGSNASGTGSVSVKDIPPSKRDTVQQFFTEENNE